MDKRIKRWDVVGFVTTSAVAAVSYSIISRRRRRKRRLRSILGDDTSQLVPPDAEIAEYLTRFEVNVERGFVPIIDPLVRLLHLELQPHEDVADRLSELLVSGRARQEIERLPRVDVCALLEDDRERRRALLLFSALASAYVWGGGNDVEPRHRVPACIAVPLHNVASQLDTAPMLSHMSNCLYNWTRKDGTKGPLRACDLSTTISFTGDDSEAAFNLITLQIEAMGGPAIAYLEKARRILYRLSSHRVESRRTAQAEDYVRSLLRRVQMCIRHGMLQSLVSMPKCVSPPFFYSRIRPYLSGWLNNATLPNGVVYEGVDGDRRMCYSGGSAAQSSLIVALDIYLGIDHSSSVSRDSRKFLQSMRRYMPAPHRRFLHELEEALEVDARASIRAYVLALPAGHPLRQAYDECVNALAKFRQRHIVIVTLYILAQQRRLKAEEEQREAVDSVCCGAAACATDTANAVKADQATALRFHDGGKKSVRWDLRVDTSSSDGCGAVISNNSSSNGTDKTERGRSLCDAPGAGKGTGGMELGPFLRSVRDHTLSCILSKATMSESLECIPTSPGPFGHQLTRAS